MLGGAVASVGVVDNLPYPKPPVLKGACNQEAIPCILKSQEEVSSENP